MPIADACFGMACKFLQTPARSGLNGHERPPLGGLVARARIASVRPAVLAVVARSGVRRRVASRTALGSVIVSHISCPHPDDGPAFLCSRIIGRPVADRVKKATAVL